MSDVMPIEDPVREATRFLLFELNQVERNSEQVVELVNHVELEDGAGKTGEECQDVELELPRDIMPVFGVTRHSGLK